MIVGCRAGHGASPGETAVGRDRVEVGRLVGQIIHEGVNVAVGRNGAAVDAVDIDLDVSVDPAVNVAVIEDSAVGRFVAPLRVKDFRRRDPVALG